MSSTAASEVGAAPEAPEAQAVIAPMRPEHLVGAVRLHRHTFPDEPLARLGARAMMAVYRTYLESPRCVAFVAAHEQTVVAAASGAIGPGFVTEVVRRHPWLIVSVAAARLLQHPTAAHRLTTLLYRRSHPWEGDPARRFYWRVIMIDPEWRGRGLMVPLVRALLQEARARGAREACSATHDHNLPMVWVQKVFGFESRAAGPGRRYYRLDLDNLR
ncbi:MAG: GNAT family N-acetyltransferase [Candidatus Binatia bacterium]